MNIRQKYSSVFFFVARRVASNGVSSTT